MEELRCGHPASPENIYYHPDGERRCRICRKAYNDGWKSENRERSNAYRRARRAANPGKDAAVKRKWRAKKKREAEKQRDWQRSRARILRAHNE